MSGVSLPTLNYNVDAMGRTTTVTTSGADPVTATTYDIASRATAVTFGSGDTANFTFDSNSGFMTLYKETIAGSAASGSLTWNANGTLQKNIITDPFNSANAQTCTYSYDDLTRVKSVGCGTPWSQTFAYDAFGNLTKSGSLNWQPGYNASTNRYTLGGTSYEANGNLLTDTFHTYTWNAQGKSHTIDSITLIYDALGREVEMQNGGTNTEFVPDLATMNGQTQTRAFVKLTGGTKVQYQGSSISGYLVPDWIGSVRIASKNTQAYSYSLGFAPFGEQYAAGGNPPTVAWFGENPTNTVSDEYDADNRRIHSSQGRWISPDPAGLAAVELSNPQTLNRYAYVKNNPLNRVDPTGLNDCEAHADCENIGLGLGDFGQPGQDILGTQSFGPANAANGCAFSDITNCAASESDREIYRDILAENHFGFTAANALFQSIADYNKAVADENAYYRSAAYAAAVEAQR